VVERSGAVELFLDVEADVRWAGGWSGFSSHFLASLIGLSLKD